MFNWLKNLFKSKSIIEIRKRNISDYEFNAMRTAKEKKLNSILEKISKNGIESLSKFEKETLEYYSENY